MASKNLDRFSDCKHLLRNCNKLNAGPEICRKCHSHYGSENEISSIKERLQNLPKIKASATFDQRMAAAFAMELQKEELNRNRSWLEKHSQISLPHVVSDLTKNFL